MLYLIGGSPRCGKTTLSRLLAEERRLSCFSTDLAATIINPYLTEAEREQYIAGNHATDSPQSLLEHELANAQLLWPGVRRLLFSLLKHRAPFIIEGVHLLPRLLHELSSLPNWPDMTGRVRILYLVKTDAERIFAGLKQGTKETDWLLQSVQNDEELWNAALSIREKGLYFAEEAARYGYEVINTERDFHGTLRSALTQL